MRLKAKLNSRKGFSLAETLLAVLILLLVSTIVANGIPTARNVYNNVIVGANAQVALSTAVNALRNELGMAQEVQVSNNKIDIIYFKSSIQAYSSLSVDADAGIQLLDYVYEDPASGSWEPIPVKGEPGTREAHNLVTSAASNKDLIVTYGNVTYVPASPDIITIHNIQVKRPGAEGAILAELETLVIRLAPITA